MPDEDMPADPFREGHVDWGWLAGNNAAFLSAHVAAGMAETHALELTKVYLTFALNVIFARAAQQSPEQPPDGQDQGG